MQANDTQLLNFLEGTRQFIIPIFQRQYSWDIKQCKQFWDDIISASRSSNLAHFMGSIVYIQHGLHLMSTIRQVMVIDGQQRLTTLTLLLSALAEIIDEKKLQLETTKTKLQNMFLFNHTEEGEKKYKLLLTKSDKDALINILENNPSQRQSSKLQKNYEFFLGKIRNLPNLEQLIQGINKLWIVEIGLDNEKDNPQLIYESLNSTGLPLSKSDLVRNFVLMQLDKTKQDELYNKFWHPMEQDFKIERNTMYFDRFIKDFLTIKLGKIPVIREVYNDFKYYVSINRERGIEKIVEEIYKFANYYIQFAFEKIDDSEIQKIVQDINELRVDVSYPFLLEVFEDFDKDVISKEDVLTILKLVESYVFRRAICNIPTNSLNKTFATLMRDVDKEKYVESLQATFVLMDGSQVFPKDEEFGMNFTSRNAYHLRNIKHILSKMENFDGKKERVDLSSLNVEHIMPQRVDSIQEWKNELGEKWEDVHEKYLHTIGNLTLTGYNPELSNKSFLEKRNMDGGYAESPIVLNRYLAKLESWNEEEIKKRADSLKNIAVQIWKYPEISEFIVKNYEKTGSSKKAYSEEEHLKRGSNETQKLYSILKKEILGLGNEVRFTPTRYYLGFAKNTNFVALRIRKDYVRITLVTKDGFSDTKNITIQDETTHYQGRLRKVHFQNMMQLSDIMEVIKQVFESN